MGQPATGAIPTRFNRWRKRAREVGLESQAEAAMERGDLAYYQFNGWRYTDDADWEDWLARHRVGGHSAGGA